MAKTWTPGAETPHDYWCNGDVVKMIERGSYEYFRPKLELRVHLKRMPYEDLRWSDELYKEKGSGLRTQIKFRKFIGDNEEVSRLEGILNKTEDVVKEKKEKKEEKGKDQKVDKVPSDEEGKKSKPRRGRPRKG